MEEDDPPTIAYLLEHMATQSARMARYAEFVEQAYRAEAQGSAARLRLEAAAKGTPLASKLGRIRFMAEGADFLPLGGAEVTNTFTFNGPATGAFSGSGNAATGDINALYQTQAPQVASEQLAKLIALLDADPGVDGGAKNDVAKASEAPTKSTVQKVLDWFKVVSEGGKLASSTIAAAPTIIDTLHKVLPHLPG
ncbi:hypothetical protein ACFQ1E_17690 [Sphingomonas canadensis]|uniref:Uncharacterized protein n=1 Tax=Sphingomonas canadensis TaxID=1219257 RepID=A0ABW3HAV7_9SPHN|nr:hypothetical protein [Sphingomonas canadensis]MCW3838024.1 hypothetical protein [Sphingomonas canadensis]